MRTFTLRLVRGPRHRIPMPVIRKPAALSFEPRHCAGDSCLHNHAGGSRPLVGQMRNHPRAEPAPAPVRKSWELAL